MDEIEVTVTKTYRFKHIKEEYEEFTDAVKKGLDPRTAGLHEDGHGLHLQGRYRL